MGLMSIFENESADVESQEVSSEFKKVVTTTKDISATLEEIAKKNSIATKKLDFKLLSFKTFYQPTKNDSPIEIAESMREDILKEEVLLDPQVLFFQEYKIEVFKKGSKFPIEISIGANKSFTTVRAKIKANKRVSYYDGLDEEIIAQIRKKMVKNGLMVGFMDEKLRAGVKKLISLIRVNGSLDTDVVFDVCNALAPKKSINQEMIRHYKSLKNEKRNEFAMYGVKIGDLVLELIKPKEGRDGRNCKGEFIGAGSVELSESDFKVSEDDFDIKESEESIKYYAKKDGYLHEDGGKFEIREEFVVSSIHQKTTGDIDVGEDSNVRLTVQESSSGVDAIGPGVEIDTKEICVAGHVANSAVIKAVDVEVKGQTHKTSKIESKKAKIHLHKGFVEADEVDISILEGGVVVGDIVRVDQISGGEITAREVYIKKVLSNSTIRASHVIEMDELEGNGNNFIIDTRAQRGYEEKLNGLEKELSDVEFKIKSLPKELKSLKAKIVNEKEVIEEINKNIAELKKFGKSAPASMILKVKDHQKRIKKFNSLAKELKDVKIKREELKEELSDLSLSILEAKVINNSSWREFNEVKFRLIEPPLEVSFLPKEGEVIELLTLESGQEEGEFHIKREEAREGDSSG
jgi:hypothetical protein